MRTEAQVDIATIAVELVNRVQSLSADEALNRAIDAGRRRGLEPRPAEISTARVCARAAAVARNAALGRQSRAKAEVAPAETHEWRPLDLGNPKAWPGGIVPPQVAARHPPAFKPTPFVLRDPSTLPRRDWLFGQYLIRGEVSVTLAPGGVGKTALGIAETLSLVTGRCLLHDAPSRPYRVWLWNGEEPDDELARRLGAAALHYGIGPHHIADRLFTDTGHSTPLVLGEQTGEGTKIFAPVIDRLVEALTARDVDIMIVDPFVSTHHVHENDNSAMQRVASAWKEVAHRAHVAVSLAHHTRKLSGREATAEDSRGADALISKARSARALNPMSEDTASKLGVSPRERESLFFTGPGGKSNMAPRTNSKTWFRLVSVGLGNGGGINEPQDNVQVVTPWSPPDAAAAISPQAVLRLASVMAGRQWRAAPQSQNRDDWIGRAVAEAFELRSDDDFKGRAKAIIKALEADKILLVDDTTDRNRNVIKVSRLSAEKLAEFSASA